MKRWVALILSMILGFSCSAIRAEPAGGTVYETPCTKDVVNEFMAAFEATNSSGTLNGYPASEESCYNVTPDSVAAETDIQIFKFGHSCESFAMVDGAVYPLRYGFGGYGFLTAVPWDYDGDGRTDLMIASSWGSGIHRSEISVFSRAAKTCQMIYSTMFEQEPQIDLAVFLEAPAPGAEPEIVLRQVKVLYPEDYNFASLRYQVTGPYQPRLPFMTSLPPWNAKAAAPLLGVWHCTTKDGDDILDISLEFFDDGTFSLRNIDAVNRRYTEETAQYRIDGDSMIWITSEETNVHTFTISNDELSLLLFGIEQLVFNRLSEEEYGWWESLQPKSRAGDISHVEIDYGISEHFTREQMDAAMEVVKERFRDKYAGCELHQLSYSSDARSAREFEYYAGTQSLKTGKTYVDGIVFLSSFHTPPEDQDAPNSDLEPDKEYTDWNWILLLTEGGEWELVTWGY